MILYTFQPHSIIDIITNSSSELFIFKGKNKKIIEKMLEDIYPDYKKEYRNLIHIDELSAEQLDNYFRYHCNPHMWHAGRSDYPLIGDYTFDELYEPEINWRTGEIKPPYHNGELQYMLKDNTRPPRPEKKIKNFDEFKDVDPYGEEDWDGDAWNPDNFWRRSFVTEKNLEEVKDRIDPNRRMFFLYSRGDNPNWDYQKKLEKVGTRYHLG